MTTNGRLDGKVAVVTGGSRGIGEAVVRKLAAEGAAVGFTYVKNEKLARQLESRLVSEGAQVLAIQADVRDPEAVNRFVATVAETFGGIDIVVNNAHQAYTGKPFEEATREEFQREFDTLIKGAVSVIQAALPHLKARGGGSVVNVGSTMAEMPRPNHSFYVTAKCALIGLTRVLAIELGRYGVRVNIVTPGPLETEHNAGYPAEVMKRLGQETPLLGRLATCEEAASAIVMMVMDDARIVTGANVLASGGFAIA